MVGVCGNAVVQYVKASDHELLIARSVVRVSGSFACFKRGFRLSSLEMTDGIRDQPLGARGRLGGREFDPSTSGGPIRHLTTHRIKITHQDVDVVEQHLARFGPDSANQGMIQRLREVVSGQLPPSQTDLNFYAHELEEFVRSRRLGWRTDQPSRADAAYELWDNAHTATLEDYGLREGPGVLYHPTVEPQYRAIEESNESFPDRDPGRHRGQRRDAELVPARPSAVGGWDPGIVSRDLMPALRELEQAGFIVARVGHSPVQP